MTVIDKEPDAAPAELIKDSGPKVNWRVLIIASVIIIAFSIWAMLVPANAQSTMKMVVGWIAENLGWFYVLTVTVVIGFVLLHHQPHGFDVFLGITPVALGVEIA